MSDHVQVSNESIPHAISTQIKSISREKTHMQFSKQCPSLSEPNCNEEERIMLNLVDRFAFLKLEDYFSYFTYQPKHTRISKQPFKVPITLENVGAVFKQLEAKKILSRNQYGRYFISSTSLQWVHHAHDQQPSVSTLSASEVVARLWTLHQLANDGDAFELYHPMHCIATIGSACEITQLLELALDLQTIFTLDSYKNARAPALFHTFRVRRLVFPIAAAFTERMTGLENDCFSKYKYWGLQKVHIFEDMAF
jgi:hypothetical protein